MLVLCSIYGFGFRVDDLIFCLVIRKMQEKKNFTLLRMLLGLVFCFSIYFFLDLENGRVL